MALDALAHHSVDFWLQSEDLPEPDNRVTLDAKGAITLHLKDTNVEGHKRLVAKLKGMLKHRLLRASAAPYAVPEPEDPDRWYGPPERHHPFRARSENLGAGPELQGPRPGQPLRR